MFALLFTISFAQQKYDYGNIDMHGGKKESLVNKKNKMDNKKFGMSNFLSTPTKKDLKKETKAKKNK